MPISSGAGGKISNSGARLFVTSNGTRRVYWPNSANLAPSNGLGKLNNKQDQKQLAQKLGDTQQEKIKQQVSKTTTTFKSASLTKTAEQVKKIEDCQLSISSEDETETTAAMNSLGGQSVITGSELNPSSQRKKSSAGGSYLNNRVNNETSHRNNLSLGSLVAAGNDIGTTKVAISAGKGASSGYSMSSSSLLAAAAAAAQANSSHDQKLASLNPNFHSSSASSSSSQQRLASTNSSTAHLARSLNNNQQHFSTSANQQSRLTLNKKVNLKYVKTLVILLMAVDLLITVFVHQFSQQDQFSLIFTTYKLRFSLVNLLLSSIWFILFIGAILFDIYIILFIGCIINAASFVLLLVFSIIHFTHRIDYNSVNLTSLLLLLFSITVLHVYLLVMMALTTYLMLSVRKRKQSGL